MKLELGEQYAGELLYQLKPYCDRIEIAGGIRRGKKEPHDIELVVIPRTVMVEGERTLLGPVMKPQDMLYELLSILPGDSDFSQYPLQQGPKDKGGKKAPNGPKYYRLLYKKERLDIFAVMPPASWGVIMTLRTGCAEFSHWLVSKGWNKNLYFVDGHIEEFEEVPTTGAQFATMKKKIVPTPEEKDVFDVLHLPFYPVETREYDEKTDTRFWLKLK